MTKTKKLSAMLAGVLAVGAVMGSFAYYSSEHEVDNTMSTNAYGDTLTEVFTPDSDWEPGEEADKIVGVTNTGDYDIVVRIKMSETWTFSDEETLTIASISEDFDDATATVADQLVTNDGLTNNGKLYSSYADDGSVVYKELDDSNWTYNEDDGYWYYNSVLTSGSSTEALLSSITLSENTDMGVYTETIYYAIATTKTLTADEYDIEYTDNNDTYTDGKFAWTTDEPTAELKDGEYLHIQSISTLTVGEEGYAGADYVLTITSETCQATDDAILATFAAEDSATYSNNPSVTWWPSED